MKIGDLITSAHFPRGRYAGEHPTIAENVWVDTPCTGRWAFHVSDVRPLTEFSPAMEAAMEEVVRRRVGPYGLTTVIKVAKDRGFGTDELLRAINIREREQAP